jgi:hypothetical protein
MIYVSNISKRRKKKKHETGSIGSVGRGGGGRGGETRKPGACLHIWEEPGGEGEGEGRETPADCKKKTPDPQMTTHDERRRRRRHGGRTEHRTCCGIGPCLYMGACIRLHHAASFAMPPRLGNHVSIMNSLSMSSFITHLSPLRAITPFFHF